MAGDTRYVAVELYWDTDTGEYVVMGPDQVEIDRLPASAAGGGKGTVSQRIQAVAALAENANATAQEVAQAARDGSPPGRDK